MHTYLHTRFYSTIKVLLQNHPISSILISISGGQDSLCLIKLIEDFNKKYYSLIKLTYIYIDHQWKKDSKNQIQHLINIIRDNKQKVIVYQIKETVISEIKARELRYKILVQHAMSYKHDTIFTGHTETDQIETFWIQLLKGTSLNGITSLTLKRKVNKYINIYRPLLNFSRSDISWLCRKFHLSIWSDKTNYQYLTNRNRIRNEFIPYISKYFSYHTEKRLLNFIKASYLDNEYIKQNTIKAYLNSCHQTSMALDIDVLKQQHKALQIRTLQFFFS